MKINKLVNIDGVMTPITREMTKEEIAELPEFEQPETPTQLDRIEAQALYTALMTDTLIEGE